MTIPPLLPLRSCRRSRPGHQSGVVIVTGTRASGLKAENSASPVQVLDATSLARTGQPDLLQALAQNLPSLNAQAFGGDMANMTCRRACAACPRTTPWCW
jgi:hypothetical protein